MEIDYITGSKTNKIFGMSKYQNEIYNRIKDVKFNTIEYDSLTHTIEVKYKALFSPKLNESPSLSSNKTTFKSNLFSSLMNTGMNISNCIDRYRYSNLVKTSIKKDNIKHITFQELAYLLNSIKLEKSIITCYDLIPWAYDKNRSSIWKANIAGLKKANKIITISEFSKSEIVKYVKYPEEQVEIVYPAVNHHAYHKTGNENILKSINIPDSCKVILYVGSEDPRQNVDVLIKAFNELKKKLPEVKLLKIGNPNLYGAREKLLELIKKLNLQNDVIFMDFVPEEELPAWYSTSDLVVYPCSYAGFGMPPLEAMACSTPVITSNATSLPEVVGNAGIMIDPRDHDALANEMYEVLTNDGLMEDMIKKGLERAKLFSWDKSAEKTLEIYDKMS